MGDEDQGSGNTAAAEIADSMQKVSVSNEENSSSDNKEAVGPVEAEAEGNNGNSGAAGAGLVKIYVGGLPTDFDEAGIKELLKDKSLPEAETVLVKRGGYAFLEFHEQSQANEVISALDGKKDRKICFVQHLERRFLILRRRISLVRPISLASPCSKFDFEPESDFPGQDHNGSTLKAEMSVGSERKR